MPGRASVYSALAIGLIALVGIAVLSLLAFEYSRDAVRQVVADQNLSLGRTVCGIALGDLNQADAVDRNGALDRLSHEWTQAGSPYKNSYLCVIGPNGKLDVHTLKPEMKGTDVGQVVLSAHSGQTVMHLLRAHEDWSGQNTNYRGIRQLVGYHYEPSIDSLIAVHVPAAVVDSGFQAAVAPWIGSMILIGGLLLPCSLGLLFQSSRQATVLAQESEQRYRYFVEQTDEGFYRVDFEPPIAVDQSEDELIRQMYERGWIRECNDNYAGMYGQKNVKKVRDSCVSV